LLIAGLVVGAWAIPSARAHSSERRGAWGRWLFISSLLLLGACSLVAAAYRAAALAPLGLTAGLLVVALLAGFEAWGARPDNLYGVDLLGDRIRRAKENFPGLTFREANAEALPFADGFFDLVALFTVFSSILDPRMARDVSREIHRVLRSGGAVVWYDFRMNNPFNPHVRGVSRKGIRQLFPGFHSHLVTITLMPPLARRLGRLADPLYPCLTSLPFLRSHYLGVLAKP